MTLAQLKHKYVELFREKMRSHPMRFPFRRIAGRTQSPALYCPCV